MSEDEQDDVSVTKSLFMPVVPVGGGIKQIGKDSFCAWTSGPRTRDWSRLEDENVEPTALMMRTLRPGTEQVATAAREKPATKLFHATHDLAAFLEQTEDHLEKHGMDGIGYLPNPQDMTGKLLSVLKYHTRYTAESAKGFCDPIFLLYDSYDKSNNNSAKQYLLESLEPKLRASVKALADKDDLFPTLLMHVVEASRSTALGRFDNLKNVIKSRKPSQYAGHNISLMVTDVLNESEELIVAGQYDHNLTLQVVRNFKLSGHDDWKFKMRFVEAELEKHVTETMYLPKAEADKHMAKAHLTMKDVCKKVVTIFRSYSDEGVWPHTRSSDSKVVPPKFDASVNVSVLDSVQCTEDPQVLLRALALLQTQNTQLQSQVTKHSSQKSGNCHNCGQPGHWAASCPQKQGNTSSNSARSDGNRSGGSGANRGSGRNRGGGTGGRRHGPPDGRNWKKVPPTSGGPQTKTVNGQKWYWCAVCGRWSTTHGTAGHTGSSSTPAANTVRLQMDPSAWHVSFGNEPWYQVLIMMMSHFWLPILRLCTSLVTLYCVPMSLWSSLYHGCQTLVDVFNDHWTHFLPPVLWILLFMTSGFGPWYFHRHRPPDKKWSPGRKKQFYRSMRHRLRGHGTRRRRRTSYGMHRRVLRRPCMTTLPWHLVKMHREFSDSFSKKLTKCILDQQHGTNRYQPASARRAYTTVPVRSCGTPPRPRMFGREGGNGTGSPMPCSFNRKPNYKRKYFAPCRPGKPVHYKGGRADVLPTQTRPKDAMLFAFIAATNPSDIPSYVLNGMNALRASMSPDDWTPATTINDPSPTPSVSSTMSDFIANTVQRSWTTPKEGWSAIIVDTGANISVTNDKSDFVGPMKKPRWTQRLQGLASGARVSGTGHVAWAFKDETGMLRTLKVPCVYVPSSNVKLLSVSSLLDETGPYADETIAVTNTSLRLSGSNATQGGLQRRNAIEIMVDPVQKLPIGYARTTDVDPQAHSAVIHLNNHNLSPAEKELLHWHFRLGHLSFRKIQFLMRSGVLASSIAKRHLHKAAAKLSPCPKCAACQYGKQRRTTAPGRRTQAVSEREGALRTGNLFSGQRVSTDHFKCSTRGRLLHTFGREGPERRYEGGAIFVDHSSGYVFIHFQVHLNTHETLEAKESFEAHCRDSGVIVQEYLSDNGSPYTSAGWKRHLEQFAQISRYAGCGAHHHNGLAEVSIKSIMSISRTMLLHSAIHWPEVADAALWPLAVNYAVYLFNRVPNTSTGISPHDIFTQTRFTQAHFANMHVFGCPAYVLDKAIADGRSIPRWKPRTTRHMFVGISSRHASTVPLILNLTTGAITAQFHVVLDDNFATVDATAESLPDFGSAPWMNLFSDSTYQYVEDEDDLEPAPESPDDAYMRRFHSTEAARNTNAPPVPLDAHNSLSPIPQRNLPSLEPNQAPPVNPPLSRNVESLSAPQRLTQRVEQVVPSPRISTQQRVQQVVPSPVTLQESNQQRVPSVDSPVSAPSPTPNTVSSPTPVSATPSEQSLSAPVRRSRRIQASGASRPWEQGSAIDRQYESQANMAYFATLPDLLRGYKVAAKKDPDSPSYDEAMRSPQREQWLEAIQKEISDLETRGTWEEVDMSTVTGKIIPVIFVLQVKRTAAGEIKKYKARACCRGDLQEDVGETYAPVAAWSTIRLVLVLSILMDWVTLSVDFTQAFCQSDMPADRPTWIHLPRGFRSTRPGKTCLFLKKSLYGTKFAANLWWNTLAEALLELGFKRSSFDPCLFYKSNMLLVCYVDDCEIAAEREELIDELIADLRKKGFALTKDGTFAEFLGIKFDKRSDGSYELTQTFLIDKILAATNMTNCSPSETPAAHQALGSDPDGEPMSEAWNPLSIVGMMLYLSTNTRHDLAFAVSQVSRFTTNTKKSHATAIKKIVRYLKGTRTKGTIIQPIKKLSLDLYVDADFAGLCGREPNANPDSVRSRTGYIIMLSGAPLLVKSQLQTSIACSTLEAEYVALSTALRVLLPLRRMLVELAETITFDSDFNSTVRARAFEDNRGAYYLATNQRVTSRTRYFLVKWHWFWSHVGVEVEVLPVATDEQHGDYATKMSVTILFKANRFAVQGW